MENLLELLASPKQVGILMGAGVSKSCGLPNVGDLTIAVKKVINNVDFMDLLSENDNVEDFLSRLQELKHLVENGKIINNITFQDVQKIEKNIKKTIYESLSATVEVTNLCKLVTWLNYINRDFEKEIFTLNYDLLLENAMERISFPYFTGFVGNVNPFFVPDSVDDFNGIYVKKSWIKLWKLHGSLNFKKNAECKIFIENNVDKEYENLLIYPSMDKYLSSRKAPFISYLDRFRKYMIESEKVLLILGYSFGDEHINDIIINGLQDNHRLSVLAFTYDDVAYMKCRGLLGVYPNISIYTDKKAFINRVECPLDIDLNIGDFNNFVKLTDSLILGKSISNSKDKSE
jgi:hypothetical protein